VGQDLVGQPSQGILPMSRVPAPELSQLCLGSQVMPGKAPLVLLHASPDRPIGMVMLGVHGAPAPIQDALQPAYPGLVMAQAFGQFQLYPSQRPIGLLTAEADA
jgi:hypothetical protein